MTLGIRAKVFLLSLGIIGVSLVAAQIYLEQALEAQITDTLRADLAVRARLVAERVAAGNGLASVAAADALADRMATVSGTRITLVAADGTVVGDSDVERGSLADVESHGSREEIVAALASGTGSSIRYSTTVRKRMLYVAVPIGQGGKSVGVARLAIPLTQLDMALDRLRRTLLAAATVSLLISTAVAVIAVRLTAGKVIDLTDVARRMAAGDLSVRTRVEGGDEITALGQALDQLAAGLSRTMEALRGERDLVAGILSSMQEGVLVLDTERRIVMVNPALRQMLLLGHDVEGRSVLSVVRQAELPELIERASHGVSAEIEFDLRGVMPRRLLVRAAGLPGEPRNLLVVFVDVTELRRLEAVRREFVANASHELRSPLSAVRAAADTLQGIDDDPAAARRFVGVIQRNAERLENLVDDMLELSRIEMREYKLALEPVAVAALVEQLVSQHGHRAEAKQITLGSSVPPGLAARADRRALEHVLGNLLDNALKYCPAGSSISVSAASDGSLVRIAVADTGPGVAREHLPRLFERFYRVDAGRSRELGGTGLGLSIVKHLVEAMGGQVHAESQPGAGAVFTVTLQQA